MSSEGHRVLHGPVARRACDAVSSACDGRGSPPRQAARGVLPRRLLRVLRDVTTAARLHPAKPVAAQISARGSVTSDS